MSIALEAVTKSFRTGKVLDGISLDIAEGERLVLFGPSGAGKTVLLRCIAGVETPDAGTVRLHGRDMTGVEPEDRGVGMAFQNFALFPHMDAAQNIAAPLTARRMPRAQADAAVLAVARLLKIDHVLHHAPRALSNGQKQRTALARALVAEPSVLLLDDPLRNVDAKLRFEMRLELPRLLAARHATVIYVTQDYKEAMALGDRIAVLEGGRIVQVGTPEDIYLRPATVNIARLFGDPVINLLPDGGALTGLRPEALRFVPPGTPGAIAVEVEAETPLNEKTVTLAVTAAGDELMVSRPAGTPGPAGGPAHVAAEPGAALRFDRATGARLGATA